MQRIHFEIIYSQHLELTVLIIITCCYKNRFNLDLHFSSFFFFLYSQIVYVKNLLLVHEVCGLVCV